MYLNFVVVCILSLIVNAAQAIEDNSQIVIDKVCAGESDVSINFPLELKSDIKISETSCIIFPINLGNEEVLEFAFEVHKECDNSEVNIYVYENEMEEPVVTNKFNLSANYEEPLLDKVILELKTPIVGYITVRGNCHNSEVALKSIKFLSQLSNVDIQTPIDTKFQKSENAKDGNNNTIDKDIRELDDNIYTVNLVDDDDYEDKNYTTTETDAGVTTENYTDEDTTEETNEETTKAEDTPPEQTVERPEYKIPVGLFGIILISIGCLTILALASLSSYQLGKIRGRKDLSASAVKDFTVLEDPEVPRIIPRVNNMYSEAPFGRMRPV